MLYYIITLLHNCNINCIAILVHLHCLHICTVPSACTLTFGYSLLGAHSVLHYLGASTDEVQS